MNEMLMKDVYVLFEKNTVLDKNDAFKRVIHESESSWGYNYVNSDQKTIKRVFNNNQWLCQKLWDVESAF